jgi:hypothetical protein
VYCNLAAKAITTSAFSKSLLYFYPTETLSVPRPTWWW